MTFLDPYHERRSMVHALDARVKLIVALSSIVLINLIPIQAWPVHMALLLVILATVLLARLALVSVLGRSSLALPFVLMAALGLPFVREGRALATFPILGGQVTITDVGALRFANVLVKGWLSATVAVTLIFSTHFLELARAMRSLGVPRVLVATILLMYRYLYVLVDEAQRMMRAREARSALLVGHRGGGTLRWRAQVTGSMIGTLFLRTYERSERIYSAMLARGFDGEIRTLRRRHSS